MDSKTTGTKTPLAYRSKILEISQTCENLNPNLSSPSPGLKKISNSLGAKSAKVENGDDLEPLKEARNSGPGFGFGRVAHLVKAFERLLSVPSTEHSDPKDENESKENKKERKKWALPGLQQPKVSEAPQASSAEKLGLDSQVSSSWDNSLPACFWVKSDIPTLVDSLSISSTTSGEGPKNGIESSCTVGGRARKKWLKATCQMPFNLKTEVNIIRSEKENTRPIDLKLHSDIPVVERARFNHQLAEKRSLIEQYKRERKRQQELDKEEEIKRLRKKLIPKAQPMPCFDRPFVPRRSMKQPTVPREPRFCIPRHKRSNVAAMT